MALFIFLATIKSIFLGAIWGRVDGGGIAKVSEWIERSLIMFFPVIACAPFAANWALLAYSGVIGIATGHGQYFLNRTIKAVEPESMDFIVRLFFGGDPRSQKHLEKYFGINIQDQPKEVIAQIAADISIYGERKLYWRCAFGMFITGTFFGIPAAIISLAFGKYLFALLFVCSGIAKAAAYIAGYELFASAKNPSGTEAAEYINGGLRTALCVAVIYLQFLG